MLSNISFVIVSACDLTKEAIEMLNQSCSFTDFMTGTPGYPIFLGKIVLFGVALRDLPILAAMLGFLLEELLENKSYSSEVAAWLNNVFFSTAILPLR